MSGSKRRTGYRKHLTDSALHDLPIPKDREKIVQVVSSQGSNLLEVRTAEGGAALALLPKKFSRLLWVKRNDFVIASESLESYETASGSAGRVSFIVEHVLYPAQIKHLQASGFWPAGFAAKTSAESEVSEHSDAGDAAAPDTEGRLGAGAASSIDGDGDDSLPALWQNTNRRPQRSREAGSSSSDASEDDGDR
jgi:probable RNA-binding protein EIF1AD